MCVCIHTYIYIYMYVYMYPHCWTDLCDPGGHQTVWRDQETNVSKTDPQKCMLQFLWQRIDDSALQLGLKPASPKLVSSTRFGPDNSPSPPNPPLSGLASLIPSKLSRNMIHVGSAAFITSWTPRPMASRNSLFLRMLVAYGLGQTMTERCDLWLTTRR